MIELLHQVLHVVMFRFGNTLMVMLQLLLCNLELKRNANTAVGEANLTLSKIKHKIDESSIEDIRSEIKAFLNNLMIKLKLITRYWSKLFCLMVIAVVVDAIQYQKHYYTDNEFDNKMVDENLKRMWRKNGLRKLTPLRKLGG